MYNKIKATKTSISVNKSYEGETIEQKISRIVNNREPITDGAPITYTERKDGVKPEFNIRTDRFEIAVEAMDKIQKTKMAEREKRGKLVGIDEKTTKDSPAPGAGDKVGEA